ncbi:MAG: sialidase family protein [Bacteroidales bacterium]
MKRKALYLILILALGICTAIPAQQDPGIFTTYYNSIEPVHIQLSKYPYGTVIWQESADKGASWTNIPGANQFSLPYRTDSSMYLRAVILSGTCDSLYSQYTSLETLRIFTAGVDGITDSSAIIHCEIDTLNTALTGYGILYDQRQVDYENAGRISFVPPVKDSFSVALNGLVAGTTYYACAYGLTADGSVIYGNVVDFSPVKITLDQNYDVTADSAWIHYVLTGVAMEQLDEHGIFVNAVPGSLPTAQKVQGVTVDERLTSIASGLSAGTDYFVQAYIILGGEYYYSQERKITTWSEYNEPVDTAAFEIRYRIEWNDPSTAVQLNPPGTFGEYGRVERIGSSDTLLLVYHGGPDTGDWLNIYLRKSYDNGMTWESQETLMDLEDYPGQYWRFCTPEILQLQNGWVMVAFEANARPDENQSSVQILVSKDSAKSWSDPLIYETGRTWEPSMVQLPNGEIELFYSSEAKWWGSDPIYQDIQVIRSTDNGESWSDPTVVAYYPEKRDGMPVPLVLQGNKGVVFGIECVGSSNSPYIVHRDMNGPWILETSDFISGTHRWLVDGFSSHGGAPYILQLPTGEVVCSAHIYRGGDWHQNNYQEVIIGDNGAKNFQDLTYPWGLLPWGESAVNNSLFLKDETTMVTISTRMFSNGTGGLYWLEGKIVSK